jgi:cytochrome-b5 reductase
VGLFNYAENKYQHLILIAGGVGVTPMLQLIRAILSNPKDTTKITFYYFNTEPKDILMKDELDLLSYKHKNQFQIHYGVSKVLFPSINLIITSRFPKKKIGKVS